MLLKNFFISFLTTATILAMPNPLPARLRRDLPYATPFTSQSTPRQVSCETAKVMICRDVNWKTNCVEAVHCIGSAPESCTVLDGQASAIGPERGFFCNFYRSDNCRDTPGAPSGVLTLRYPGEGFLTNRNWNDAVRSYQCFKD